MFTSSFTGWLPVLRADFLFYGAHQTGSQAVKTGSQAVKTGSQAVKTGSQSVK